MASPSFDDLLLRVSRVERRATRWRRIAVCVAAVAVAGGLMALRSPAAPTLEGDRLILREPFTARRAVELLVTPGGVLQVQFLGDSNAVRAIMRRVAFVLLDQTGKEIAHVGGPAVRNLAR